MGSKAISKVGETSRAINKAGVISSKVTSSRAGGTSSKEAIKVTVSKEVGETNRAVAPRNRVGAIKVEVKAAAADGTTTSRAVDGTTINLAVDGEIKAVRVATPQSRQWRWLRRNDK